MTEEIPKGKHCRGCSFIKNNWSMCNSTCNKYGISLRFGDGIEYKKCAKCRKESELNECQTNSQETR